VQYDGVGNRHQLTWPSGTNGSGAYYVTYQYDSMNRMTEIDQNGSTSTPLAKYQWDLLSRQTQITYGDGTTDSYSQYDAADNLETLTQTYAGADNSVTFSYAWQKNHQRASVGVSDIAFQYVPPTSTTTYPAANPDNGYISLDNSITGNTNFTYDGNQNMTFDGFNTLTYDVENRLIEAQNGAWGTSTYRYDPLGQRKQKQVTSGAWVTTTQFVLAGNEEIADYNGVGGPLSLTVRGAGGLPVAAVTPAVDGATLAAVYYHHDAMGSTVAVTAPGNSGAADIYTYSDYGAPGAGSWATYRYAGYRYDNETGLYYVNARYYNPNLGRFLQTDPAGLSGGTNLYAYVGNDPVNLLDPLGLCATDASLASGVRLVPDIDKTPGDSYAMRDILYQMQNTDGTSYRVDSQHPPLYVSELIKVISGDPPQATVPVGNGTYTSSDPQADSFQDGLGNKVGVTSSSYIQSFIVSTTPGVNPSCSAPVIVQYGGIGHDYDHGTITVIINVSPPSVTTNGLTVYPGSHR
jgi:RHS repeat-associated protein